ncbi:hypothetical protein C6W22_18950 [Bacillus atrophaeus]|uniref:hypothetical protein n=1 Tax=Bacillus atrophaeus TaxID=1452 RepID=UPI00032E3EED|nr:hypothetical protein [Bacillus atrophaeus]AKL86929.1 hypothetical protein D068_cds41530 [Bacillus atrophaeus UCMB-5137]MDS9995584.1 hypothetical protein [Bacillus atrophaeus]PRS04798.1 hypothetical protein C6W22_18950 [Bacillus atrophaeus]QUF65261.1 hypothetical protein KCX77_19755 [Bacillus atrophaeus]
MKRKLAKKLKENTRHFLIKEVNKKLKRCEGKGFTYQFVEVEQRAQPIHVQSVYFTQNMVVSSFM